MALTMGWSKTIDLKKIQNLRLNQFMTTIYCINAV